MYNHIKIEKKWKEYWVKNKTFKFIDDKNKEKFYVLDMFPYPSGAGLHVGHPKGYTASDVISRYKRLNGYSVLHPIGWDAFGLPAEQYAIQTNNHPKEFTTKNINNFRQQLQRLGFDFDYDKEVCTTDEKFYKWTQWIFVQLYKNGLAEIQDCDVNWCEDLKIVLANEEIVKDKNGNFVSERGGYPVSKKKMKQWVLKITKYADELLEGLDDIEWNEGLKNIQKKWIGRQEGKLFYIKIQDSNIQIPIFIENINLLTCMNYIAIAADSNLIDLFKIKEKNEIAKFIEQVKNKKDFERTKKSSNKNGLKLDFIGINPLNNKTIPIYLVDYILPNYGLGATIGNSILSENDAIFCKDNNIEIADKINIEKIDSLENKMQISDFVTYKLKDWLFSRQRYWGEPFPVLFDENGKAIIEENLPLTLPELEDFSPSNDGTSPLNKAKKWMHVEIDGKLFRRDTNTMPQWAGSCWYYIAYLLKNDDDTYTPLDSKEARERLKRWLPVDVYIGGQEHAVLHLLYARFWHRFLYKIGVVDTKEPFYKMVNQGMILDPIGQKISKSVGNVISVDEICEKYGADALRLYEMFMGPLTQSAKWSDESINGVKLWLNRIHRIFENAVFVNNDEILKSEFNEMCFNVTKNIEDLQFNLAISQMMVFTNYCSKNKELSKKYMKYFLAMLSCFAPFLAQELYENYFEKNKQIAFYKWPNFANEIKKETFNLPIQINGKLKELIVININDDEPLVKEKVMSSEKILNLINDKKVVKEIYIKNKIYNIIVK